MRFTRRTYRVAIKRIWEREMHAIAWPNLPKWYQHMSLRIAIQNRRKRERGWL